MSSAPRGIARFDSAAAMVGALGACLHGEPFSSPSGSPLLDRSMPLINLLPRFAREWAYSIGGATEAIGERAARRLDIETIATWLADRYPRRQYPAAFVGSSNGALVHLAAAMGVPWLPQTFLCPVRAPGSDPDDAAAGLRDGRHAREALLAADGRIAVHHMHDPNQDRLMLRTMRYYRIKQRALALGFREFLLRSLPAGATLYVDICTLQWPVTRIGERAFFQFGAAGGATREEYFGGGPRVREYLARYGSARTRWDPPSPDAPAPEAEWGFDMSLLDSLRALAQQADWRLVEFRFEEPESLSFFAFDTLREWYCDEGIEPRHLVVDSFVLLDPYTTMHLGALPFWLVFCTEPSARNLTRLLQREGRFEHIDLMLFSHGTEGVGVVPAREWQTIIASASPDARLCGVDAKRFPRDFATFVRFDEALARRGSERPRMPLPAPLSVQAFDAALLRHGSRYGVAAMLPRAEQVS
ncbi:hypothetical protein [Paraburkholderia sp. JPY419]|uniref:hypothetical protein n=1 Tax=Paraburkholderia sp. JPY419 TaxID=667660 RepID=UPI003D19127C